MHIQRLDHVNLRTTRLAEMVEWYETVLGLMSGPRPDFGFAGAWLYAGDVAAVHLIEVEDDGSVGSEAPLKMEHVAFRAEGATTFEARLTARGETFRKSDIASIGLVAFNVWDPDGNHLHIDFQTSEA